MRQKNYFLSKSIEEIENYTFCKVLIPIISKDVLDTFWLEKYPKILMQFAKY